MTKKKHPTYPVLLVDDEEDALASYRSALLNNGINNTICCTDSCEVMTILDSQAISVVILDLIMPHIPGEELLVQIGEKHPAIPVIVITGNNEVETAVACMKDGAFDYMVKPVEKVRLSSGVNRAIEMKSLQQEVNTLARQVFSPDLKYPGVFKDIISDNEVMRSIFRYIEAVADSPRPVLITGESGVGKDLLARAIHDCGNLDGEFVTVNVGGLDDTMFSDTLFGHRKGAFTGATSTRKGFIEHASEGTLFLDEIGELENSSQVKLLRLLQNNEYYMLGSDVIKKAKTRIVAATNLDLNSERAEGGFRKDLYHRLSTHHIHVPPLRERLEDIPLLLDHFIQKAAKTLKKKKPTLPENLCPLLRSYSFPGNIRELESMIFNAVSLHKEGILSSASFKEVIANQQHTAITLDTLNEGEWNIVYSGRMPTLKEAEDFLIAEAMKKSNGNQSVAALYLGISQSTLSRRFKK